MNHEGLQPPQGEFKKAKVWPLVYLELLTTLTTGDSIFIADQTERPNGNLRHGKFTSYFYIHIWHGCTYNKFHSRFVVVQLSIL